MKTDRAEGAEDTKQEATRSASPQQEEHTPGPWKWAYDKSDPTEGHSVVLLGGHKGPGIASHRTWTCDHCLYPEDGAQFKEAEANARLIAAAPDLLEACRLFVDAHTTPDYNRAVGKAKLAIQKAVVR